MKTYKKVMIVVGVLGIVAAGGFTSYLYINQAPQSMQDGLMSKQKTFRLTTNTKDLILRDSTEIVGKITPKDDQSLMYSILKAESLVGAGTISPNKDGSFSRNVSFLEKVESKTPLILKLYTVDKEGKERDELSLPAHAG
jgi:hypothetical protein